MSTQNNIAIFTVERTLNLTIPEIKVDPVHYIKKFCKSILCLKMFGIKIKVRVMVTQKITMCTSGFLLTNSIVYMFTAAGCTGVIWLLVQVSMMHIWITAVSVGLHQHCSLV